MVYINSISYYLPDNIVTNEKIVSDYLSYNTNNSGNLISEEDVFQTSGVYKRYSAEIDETAKDIGVKAANILFEEWNIDRNEIEYLIFVSDALDYKGPTTACVMQNDLKLSKNCAAIDVLHGCTGFIYGLNLAKALISSGQCNNVLLVTSDTPTKVVHPSDFEIRALFSDAAAATLISNQKIDKQLNFEISNFVFGTDGSGELNLYVERSATKNPADVEWLKQHEQVPGGMRRGRMIMNNQQIFLFAYRKIPTLIDDIILKNNITFKDVDFFVLHQANGQILNFIRKKLQIPEEKFIINIADVGNTVSASIPIALKQMIDEGKFNKGKTENILIGGFGIGYSWGGTYLKTI